MQESRAAIGECLLRDQPRLRRQLAALDRRIRSGQPSEALAARLESEIRASMQVLARRDAQSAPITFPGDLPVSKARSEICAAITGNQVVIVCGETGSGKTTQLPKMCLEMGRGRKGQIGHTQPRRIAARSVARRIAAELGSQPGALVGYQTRFDKSVSDASRIKLMTDGILLSELRHDRLLRQYDTLIIDEAHERSLNIDFLLGYLHTLLKRRKDLKLIITSATIDTDKFSQHFDQAPVLEISGRTYPVDIEYLPEGADDDGDTAELVAGAVSRLLDAQKNRGRGDILVFLPGERFIGECRDLLRRRFREKLEILPLFGRLSARDQDVVFRAGGRTRCVLATNIAETSLTVPGIRYVIDSGLARISRYSVRSKVQQLPIEKVSQASARQRAGRCGRLENGLCLRLYSEEDFLSRPEHTEPEIRRTNLARVILEMAALRLGDIEEFPFVDRPDGRYVRDGYRLLQELQAVDDRGKVLQMGRKMARLPVDPRIARMLLAAAPLGCLADMLIIAAALSVPDPRQRPADKREAADLAHAKFADSRSDFIGLLTLWSSWKSEQQAGSGSALRRWCKERFLSFARMREWQDLVHQLHGLTRDARKRGASVKDRYASLHQALLTGLLGHVGIRTEKGAYQATRGRVFYVFPGSGTSESKAPWVVAAQLIETSRLFAHIVAGVKPGWVEKAAGHLVRRRYQAPVWRSRRGRVVAQETVTLYGLVLAADREVDFGAVDAGAAREVFIREALVGQRLGFEVAFLAHNIRLVDEIKALEDRSRRQDILVDDDAQCAFYEARLPQSVFDSKSLKRWLRSADPEALRGLQMQKKKLMRHAAEEVTGERFPDEIEIAGNSIALAYNFERGSADDGVTAVIPLKLLNQLPGAGFDYLVPGLLPAKVEALIRGLPKKLRRNFVPVPQFTRAALEDLPSKRPPITAWLANKLQRMSGLPITPAELSSVVIPDHLLMNYRLVDDGGQPVAESRDLQDLRNRFGERARHQASRSLAAEYGRKGIRQWDFGELPERIETDRDGQRLGLYPALEDAGDSVSLVFHDTPEDAATITAGGLARLARLALPQQYGLISKDLRAARRDLLQWRHYGDEANLARQVFDHLARAHFLRDGQALPRTREDFVGLLDTFRSSLVPEAGKLIGLIGETLALDTAVRRKVQQLDGDIYRPSIQDAEAQRARLLYPGFVSESEASALARYPVYLQALDIRLTDLPGHVAKDQASMALVAPAEDRLAALGEHHPDWLTRPFVREYRWLLEEFRVSVFAQKLGAARKVSAVRLERYWAREITRRLQNAGHVPDV